MTTEPLPLDNENGSADNGHQIAESAPDAIAILTADHARVKQLFERALGEDAGAIGKQRATIEEICRELELHAKIEETIFYPALRARTKANDEDRQEVLEAYEEHASVKDLIKKIRRSTGRDETLKAKVKVLSELVEHHVAEEEGQMFDDARRLLGEQRLRKVGLEIAQAKTKAARRTAHGTAKKGASKHATVQRGAAKKGGKKSGSGTRKKA